MVLAGGGVLGIGHSRGPRPGSIVAALLASGMPAPRMHAIVGELDYLRFRDRSVLDRLPLVGPPASVLLENGFYEGDYLREWLAGERESQGVRTFGDLRVDDPGSSLPPERRYRLVVMATDLTRGELVRLPWDYADRYGLDPDEQLVADAVRASSSIPYFFEPVRLDHRDGGHSLLVDGGVLSNYPLEVFDRIDGRPRWPTFGVTLLPRLPAGSTELFPLLGVLRQVPSLRFLESLVTTLVVGRDQGYLSQPWVAARSIEVDALHVNPVDFGLDHDTVERLYESGRDAAGGFLANWDWQRYLEQFRPTVEKGARRT